MKLFCRQTVIVDLAPARGGKRTTISWIEGYDLQTGNWRLLQSNSLGNDQMKDEKCKTYYMEVDFMSCIITLVCVTSIINNLCLHEIYSEKNSKNEWEIYLSNLNTSYFYYKNANKCMNDIMKKLLVCNIHFCCCRFHCAI